MNAAAVDPPPPVVMVNVVDATALGFIDALYARAFSVEEELTKTGPLYNDEVAVGSLPFSV